MRFWYKNPPLTPQAPGPVRDVALHEYQHRGYRALLFAKGESWRVEIYAPGSDVCARVIEYDGAPAALDVITEDIKQIIDSMV